MTTETDRAWSAHQTVQRRRRRLAALDVRPAPWSFAEWLEWAEVVAAFKLARGEAFMIAANAAYPDRSRTMSDWSAAGRYAIRYEIGARAARYVEEQTR